jgi:hypothetical protein
LIRIELLAKKQHKLAALRLLSDEMSELEKEHQQRIERGDDPAEADREAARMALTSVSTFFQDHGIEAKPLVRLLGELVALSAGSRPSRMLTPTVTRHRRPDAPTVETIKGRLAAIMEFRQEAGLTRKAAGEWVIHHLPSEMKRKLGLGSQVTVSGWLVKWGGQRGATSGSGRDGYLRMRAILQALKPAEPKLKKTIERLARSLPS